MQATPARPAGVATRAGLITGLFAGILSLPFITLLRLSGAPGLAVLFLLIALVAYAIAGYLATRRSGLLRSGVGAGALAAAITLFIAICLGIVILALLGPRLALGLPIPGTIAHSIVHSARGPVARAAMRRIMGGAGLTILASLFVMGIGLLGGFFGGLLGRIGRPRQPASPAFSAPRYAPNPPPITPITPITPAIPVTPFAPSPSAPSYPTGPGASPYAPPATFDLGDTPTITDGDLDE